MRAQEPVYIPLTSEDIETEQKRMIQVCPPKCSLKLSPPSVNFS